MQKYPDGPDISFRSRATRISASWYINLYLLNGKNAAYDSSYVLAIAKNGTYQVYGNSPDIGVCQFEDKHKSFYMQPNAAGSPELQYTILRLEYKELWFKRTKPNGDVEEIHYTALSR